MSPIERRPEAVLMYFFLATASGGPLFREPGAKTVFLVARCVVLLLPCFKVRGSVGPDGSWENGHYSPRGQPSGDLRCLHACLQEALIVGGGAVPSPTTLRSIKMLAGH